MSRGQIVFISVIVSAIALMVCMQLYAPKVTYKVEISFCDGRVPIIDSVCKLSWFSFKRDVINIETYKRATPIYYTRNATYVNVCGVKIIGERKW